MSEGFIDFCERNTQQKSQVIKPARLPIDYYREERTGECRKGQYSNSKLLLKTTQNLNQQNNAEILCKNDYALSF